MRPVARARCSACRPTEPIAARRTRASRRRRPPSVTRVGRGVNCRSGHARSRGGDAAIRRGERVSRLQAAGDGGSRRHALHGPVSCAVPGGWYSARWTRHRPRSRPDLWWESRVTPRVDSPRAARRARDAWQAIRCGAVNATTREPRHVRPSVMPIGARAHLLTVHRRGGARLAIVTSASAGWADAAAAPPGVGGAAAARSSWPDRDDRRRGMREAPSCGSVERDLRRVAAEPPREGRWREPSIAPASFVVTDAAASDDRDGAERPQPCRPLNPVDANVGSPSRARIASCSSRAARLAIRGRRAQPPRRGARGRVAGGRRYHVHLIFGALRLYWRVEAPNPHSTRRPAGLHKRQRGYG